MFRVLLTVSSFVLSVSAGPVYESDRDYKETLLSIDEKLRNIENSLNVQYVTALNGKIDYYGSKIDKIEKDLSRFQLFTRRELDKISENINAGNFKDDATKDKTVRKIDAIYERIVHKLDNIEGQIDLSFIKFQGGRDTIVSKLEKIEETLTIRDSDMEAELADAIAAIDDLKMSCSNIEGNVINVTKETAKMLFKHSDRNLKKHFNQTLSFLEKTNQSFSLGITKLSDTINFLTSQVNNNSILMNITNKEFNENMNDYGNKMIDAFSDMADTTITLQNKIEYLAKLANSSSIEQQNSLRALTVEVGRNVGKPSEMSMNDQNFKNLSDDINSKFESIMETQITFIEGCHRVQMDESQLETQISVVLDKLIDIFANKTAIGPKDIHKLENLIRMHDVTVKRNFNQATNEFLKAIQQISLENEEEAKKLKTQLEETYIIVQDILASDENSKITRTLLHIFHDLQQQFNKTGQKVISSLQENYANISLEKINLNTRISNMQNLLEKIENTVSKKIQVQNETNFESLLVDIFGENPNKNLTSQNQTNIDKWLTEIFGEKPNKNVENTNSSLLCFNAANNTKCETHTAPKQSPSKKKCLKNSSNFIDGKANFDEDCNESKNSSETAQVQETTNNAINCSSDYGHLIDVRFGENSTNNCSSTDQIKFENKNLRINKSDEVKVKNNNLTFNNCSDYGNLIDVRSGNSDCNPTPEEVEVEQEQIEQSEIDQVIIDEFIFNSSPSPEEEFQQLLRMDEISTEINHLNFSNN